MRLLSAALLLTLLAAGCLDGAPSPATSSTCPDEVRLDIPVTVPDLAGGGRVGETARYDVPVDLAAAVPAGFAWACVRAVEVRLAWTNTATSGADLYVGVEVPASGLRVLGHDAQQLVGDGAHEETVLAPFWGPHDPAGLAEGLVVLVLTDWASLSQGGVPATVTVMLRTAPAPTNA